MPGAVLASPTRRAPRFGRLWIVPPSALLAGLFLYPLLFIVREAISSQNGAAGVAEFARVVQSSYFLSGLWNTALIAASATAGCLALGFVLALILAFAPFPGAVFVARLIDTFIALPSFLVTLAFTFLYGSAGALNEGLMSAFSLPLPPINFLYTAWGVILAEVTVYTPFVLRPLLAAFSLIDRSQIEAASILGARPLRIIRAIIFPAAIPALMAGGSLCLLLTVNEFGIVLFIGAKGVITLPLLIYDKAIQESDYQTACIIAVINIVLSLVLFGLYRFAASRFEGA